MCNCVPPLVNHAARYRQFEFDIQVNGSLRQKAIDIFQNMPSLSIDSSWNIQELNFSSEPFLFFPPSDPEHGYRKLASGDEYSSSYLLSQVLAQHISVELIGPELKVIVGNRSNPNKPYSMFIQDKPAVGDLKGPIRPPNHDYDDEFLAQNSEPELFLLWICRGHLIQAAHPDRLEAIGELLDIASMTLAHTVLRAKYLCKVLRPVPNPPSLVPIPQHSSWPGGHAFLAGAYATLIHKALPSAVATPKLKTDLENAAKRIAKNREAMGLHWSQDAEAGLLLGKSVMSGLLNLAENDTYAKEIRPAHFGELIARSKLK